MPALVHRHYHLKNCALGKTPARRRVYPHRAVKLGKRRLEESSIRIFHLALTALLVRCLRLSHLNTRSLSDGGGNPIMIECVWLLPKTMQAQSDVELRIPDFMRFGETKVTPWRMDRGWSQKIIIRSQTVTKYTQ
jgi:hypothetical protein